LVLPALAPTVDPDATLQALTRAGAVGAVKAAVERDASAAVAKDEDGRILLHWAASAVSPETVTYLLSLPAVRERVDLGDEDGWTALHCAVAAGRPEAIAALTAAGASPRVRNVNGQTPLHYHKGRAAVVRALLPHVTTADVNAADRAGQTPLHRAAGAGSVEVVGCLLSATSVDVHVNAADRRGQLPRGGGESRRALERLCGRTVLASHSWPRGNLAQTHCANAYQRFLPQAPAPDG
jgi:26S proteasome non-ATPase regulatory subunit 10